MRKRLCRWCGLHCGGQCLEAKAASVRWAAHLQEEALLKAQSRSKAQEAGADFAAAYADPKQHEELARKLFG